MSTKKLTELALLTAVALIIFVVELRIPNLVPIAGVKLGLANIITVYAVFRYKPNETAMIVTARLLLGAMFSGTAVTLLYSASGAFLCLVGMLSLRNIIPKNWIWLCSITGAIFHNIGQIIMAVILMKTTAVLANLPILMISGCIAGAFTGLCAQLLLNRLERKHPPENRHHEI